MESNQTRNESVSKSITRNRNKTRHKLSDAKWRANLARCYNGLRRVLTNSESAFKRKRTKATILKETVSHILFLENTVEALMREKAHRDGNHCGPLPWESSLDYFRNNFLVYEEELSKEVSGGAINFTSTISSNSSHLTARLDISNKNNQPSNFEMIRGHKSSKECSGLKRKPLGEISNVIIKPTSEKSTACSLMKSCIVKNPVTDNQVFSLRSPLRDTNFGYHCPPTPVKINKSKEVPSLKRRIRSRKVLEKLMNRIAYKGNRSCVKDNANFEIEVDSQHAAKLTEIPHFPQKRIQEPETLPLDDGKSFRNKTLREMPKAPVIMKIQKATGSLQDKNHDLMNENCNDFLSHDDNTALDCMSFQSKDFSALEEMNQEVPESGILHKKQSLSSVEVPYLPEIQGLDNNKIIVLLVCKGDQEVPESNETFMYSNSHVKNSTECSNKTTAYPLCESFRDTADNILTLQPPEAFSPAQKQLNETSTITKQSHAYGGILKQCPKKANVKNSSQSSQNFLMQEQDPILTSANFTGQLTSVIECPQKTSSTESPNKNSIDNTQYTACQQTGCCWSPCQELSSATLFDTGYHDINEDILLVIS